jgi:predicted aspartyl protease
MVTSTCANPTHLIDDSHISLAPPRALPEPSEAYALDGHPKTGVHTSNGESQALEAAIPHLQMMSSFERNSYYVMGNIAGVDCVMLLDTGCSHSVLPWKLYEELPKEAKLSWRPARNNGVLADGSPVMIRGCAEVRVKIGGTRMTHEFQLADIEEKTLLGMDFFRKHRCVLDIHKCRISIDGKEIVCCDVHGNPLVIQIQILCAWLTRLPEDGVEGIVEGVKDLDGLVVAASVHQPTSQILAVRVANSTNSDVKLKSGRILGTFNPVDQVEECLPSAASSVGAGPSEIRTLGMDGRSKIPEHLKASLEKWGENLQREQRDELENLLWKYQDLFSKGV